MNSMRNAFGALCLVLSLSPVGFCVETKGTYPDDVKGPVTEVEGKSSSESSEASGAVRTLTIPAASFSNTFENSNQQPGRILFRPSAGFFTADRSTGAYAKDGFQLEKSGLKIINIRLHARDNSNQNLLVQVYGNDKGGSGMTNVAIFGSSDSSNTIRTFDFPVSHTYQGTRYHTVSIWVPDTNCDVYGIEIWYED